MKTICLRLIVVLCSVFWAGAALAEGFALYEYSARGISLGGATMARKPDASALASNPALLTRLPKSQVMLGAAAVIPDGSMTSVYPDGTGTQRTELKSSTWYIPHFYYAQKLNDRWTIGVGEFSRFGLGFEYPHNWPGRENVYQVELTTASLNPNIAWAVTDKLSLAAGVEIMYVNLDLKKKTRARLPGSDTPIGGWTNDNGPQIDANIQNADSWGLGFNLAGHYQFNDQWAVGLMFRSAVKHTARGTNEITYENWNPMLGQPLGKEKGYDVSGRVNMPESVSAGVAWTPIPELSIEAGAVWTHWSNFKALNIYTEFDEVTANGVTIENFTQASNNRKNWKDAWRFNIGVEYEPLDWLALRVGYVYDQSPMTTPDQDYLVPTKNRHIYSAGVGFKYQDWTLDLAYAYIHPMDRSYKYDAETRVLDSKTKDTRTNIFSMTVGYAF